MELDVNFQLESLKDSFRTIERAITQNIYHVKQAMYRNVDPIEGTVNIYSWFIQADQQPGFHANGGKGHSDPLVSVPFL